MPPCFDSSYDVLRKAGLIMPEAKMPIGSVEMQEYLFANTLTGVAKRCEEKKHNVTDFAPLAREIRECFRFQRFAVMNWLMQNGVTIPAELLSDQTHPRPGSQFVDQTQGNVALELNKLK